jgi:polyhydroxyalkanoate synthesis regulator phasin
MDNYQQQLVEEELYEYAANLLLNENKSEDEVVQLLMNNKGINIEEAKIMVNNIIAQIQEATEEQHTKEENIVDQIYNYTAHLLISEKRESSEVIQILVEKGIDVETANNIVENINNQIRDRKNKKAYKDMICGALWCIGGIVATVADFGYIFWGAIVFGAIQFFKGVSDL